MVRASEQNKQRGGFFFASVGLLAVIIFSGCGERRQKALDNLVNLEKPDSPGREVSSERVEELRRIIAALDQKVQERARDIQDLGNYYRLLANNLMGLEMYEQAYQNFVRALEFFPDSSGIHYNAGACAGYYALSLASGEQARQKYTTAAAHYQRALAINPEYKDAARALAILYVYQLQDPGAAEPLVDRLLGQNLDNLGPQVDPELVFLKAHIKAMQGKTNEALAIYDQILKNARLQIDDQEELRQISEIIRQNKDRLSSGGFRQ